MIEYVVGFLFSTNKRLVCLVQKNKPVWQAKKLNGVGGKIESGETPHEAMIREFAEETGVIVSEWRYFAELTNAEQNPWRVHFFVAFGDYYTQTMTTEKIGWFGINPLMFEACVPNLRWLIPLALDGDVTCKASQHNWPHPE